MRRTFALFGIFTNVLFAQFRDYDDVIQSMSSSDKESMLSLLLDPRSSASRRNMIRQYLQKRYYFHFLNYGCYCIGDNISKGIPVDAIDSSCRDNFRCYQCIKKDFENCDPLNTQYRFSLVKQNGNSDNLIECTNLPGTCSRAVCECDKQLASDLRDLEDSYDNKWKEELFEDREQRCQIFENPNFMTGGGGGGNNNGEGPTKLDESCCGNYPFRYPYLPNSGKKCCENPNGKSRTYNVATKECCAGKISDIGSC